MNDVDNLAAQIKALTPADRLRLAADLLEKRRPDVAHTIAEGVVLELGAVLAMRALDRRSAQVSSNEPQRRR